MDNLNDIPFQVVQQAVVNIIIPWNADQFAGPALQNKVIDHCDSIPTDSSLHHVGGALPTLSENTRVCQ